MRYCFLLAFLLSFTVAGWAQTYYGIPALQNYGTKQHGAGLQNWDIDQDDAGLMYFANHFGVLTFDGHHWQSFPLSNGRTARSLAWSEKEKRMYVGGLGDLGYVSADSLGRHSFVSLLDSLPTEYHQYLGDVWSAESTEEGMFFLCRDYFLSYKKGRFEVVKYKYPKEGGYGFYLMWKVREELYVQSPDQGLFVYRQDSLIQPGYGKEIIAIQNPAIAYLPWENGETLLIQASGEATLMGDSNSQVMDDPRFERLKNTLANRSPYKLLPIQGYGYAVVTYDSGVILTDDSFNLRFVIDKEAGLLDSFAKSAFVDQAGNLWVVTNTGITHILINSPFTFAKDRQGMDTNPKTAFKKQDTLYVGASRTVQYSTGGLFKDLQGIDHEVWDLDTLNDQLYISSSAELLRLKQNQSVEVIDGYSIWGLVALKSRPGVAILKVYDGPLKSYELVNGKLGSPKTIKGFVGNTRHLAEDHQGWLWIANGHDSIMRLSLNGTRDSVTVTSFSEANGLPKALGNDLISFPDETNLGILICSGDSYYRYDVARDTFLVYQPLEGLMPGVKYSIFDKNPSGDLFLFSGNQFGRLSPSGETFVADTTDFHKINETGIQKVVSLPDSTALFLGPEGLVQYHPRLKSTSRLSFKTRINEVRTATGLIYGGAAPSQAFLDNQSGINHGNPSLVFSYGALSFDEPEKNLFSYKLDGYDKQWSAWSDANYKEYTNLREGVYIFRVRSQNLYGQIGEEATFTFTIYPPWYRSSLAYVGYGLLLLLLLWGVVRVYTNRLVREKEKLEQIVKERTLEISRQKDELKAANDKLVELGQFKEEMTAMIVHDLKNPLAVIIRRGERKVAGLARKMLNLVLNLLDVQRFEEASLRLSLVEVSFTKVLNQALGQVKDALEENNLKLEVKSEDSLRLRMDEELIERVLVNLLTNAIKYAPVGSGLAITVAKQAKNSLYFALQDEGPGVPEALQTHIFHRYVRGEEGDNERVRSSGLGLTFCKLAIEAHGGEIGLDSTEGEGSTFWFLLPDAVDSEAAQITELPVLDLKLDEDEKQQLAGIMEPLLKLDLHQSTLIESLIEGLNAPEGTALYHLGQQLIDAAYNGEEERFRQLLKDHL